MSRLERTEEKHYEIVDPETGEITHEAREVDLITAFKNVDEERFVKVYYDVYMATLGANQSSLSPFLMAIGKRMTYSQEGQIVILIKQVRDDIANELGVSYTRVSHMITECVKLGILIRTGRSVYAVSPFVMAKGDWPNVKRLQMRYDAELKKMEISAPRPKYLQLKGDWIDE